MWWSDYWPMPGMFFGPVLMFLFVLQQDVGRILDNARPGP